MFSQVILYEQHFFYSPNLGRHCTRVKERKKLFTPSLGVPRTPQKLSVNPSKRMYLEDDLEKPVSPKS